MTALPAPMERWLLHLQGNRRYAAHTLICYRRDLLRLAQMAGDMPLDSLSSRHIRQFAARLHEGGLGPRSLARALAAWRGFFQWHARETGLPGNPAAGVPAPKAPRSLPKALSVEQAQALLDSAPARLATEPVQRRDKAMFELLYSSGLRLAELTGLDHVYRNDAEHRSAGWLDMAGGEVHVLGKGGKRRSVPVGRAALQALREWLEVRTALLNPAPAPGDAAALFVGARGRRISPRVVQAQLARFALAAGLPVHVHPHVLRHSFASHVLQSAQDLRAVQEMLGHANVATTQIYTRLDFQHLAAAYDKAHPRAGRKS